MMFDWILILFPSLKLASVKADKMLLAVSVIASASHMIDESNTSQVLDDIYMTLYLILIHHHPNIIWVKSLIIVYLPKFGRQGMDGRTDRQTYSIWRWVTVAIRDSLSFMLISILQCPCLIIQKKIKEEYPPPLPTSKWYIERFQCDTYEWIPEIFTETFLQKIWF